MIKTCFESFPILKTNRLNLRQLTIGDVNEIFALRSNQKVNKYIDRKACKSITEANIYINKVILNIKNNELMYWVITMNNENKLIGTISLFDFSNGDDKGEIGYELLPEFQGKGIMQEAISKIIEFGFQNMKLNVIEASTHFENQSSIKLLEKNNFKKQPNSGNKSTNNFIIFKMSSQ